MRWRRLAAASVPALLVALAGCATDGSSGLQGPEPFVVPRVTFNHVPQTVAAGAEVLVVWQLWAEPSYEDAATGQVAETAFAYSMEPVSAPRAAADYDELAGLVRGGDAPGRHEGVFVAPDSGIVHGRAYALHEGRYTWSYEVRIHIVAASS